MSRAVQGFGLRANANRIWICCCAVIWKARDFFCDNDLNYRISIRNVDKNTFDFLYKYIIEHRMDNSPLKSGPLSLKRAIWAKPELYCVVEYMQEMESGYLREAVFKGIKMD